MKGGQPRNHWLAHNAAAHDGIASSYDEEHSEIYNPVEQARLAQTLDELLHLLGRRAPEVLDFGAGTGNLSLKFLAKGCRVTAIDVSVRSLQILAQKAQGLGNLSVEGINTEHIPFPDASFDIVACYSVLHHVPDYLFSGREMARVLRPGGILYVDHEANETAWTEDVNLAAYRHETRLSMHEHLVQLVRTRQLLTFAFAKTVFMKALVNPRYQREGDLHVWPDDHIEWDKLADIWKSEGVQVVRSSDYLLYQPRGGMRLFQHYLGLCSDTKYVFAQKRE